MHSNQKIFALRLNPGNDLKKSIFDFAKKNNIEAGYLITCVGSLKMGNIRLAGKTEAFCIEDKFEILALSGTVSVNGVHLHIVLADSIGKTIGGHLLDGNIIHTTAEIIIGEAPGLLFTRAMDPATGYSELLIQKREL